MRGRTVTAVAGAEKLYVKTSSVFQYDYGLKLIIEGLQLPESYDVHFCNTDNAAAKTVHGDANGVDIPDEYLRSGENVHAYVYLRDPSEYGYTVYHIEIPVVDRAALDTEDVTPIEHTFVEDALEKIADDLGKSNQNVLNYPYINEDRYWMVYDATLDEFVNTGVRADGQESDNTIRVAVRKYFGDVEITDAAENKSIGDETCVEIVPTQYAYTPSPWNRNDIIGCSGYDLTHEYYSGLDQYSVSFPSDVGVVYNGVHYIASGKLVVKSVLITLHTADMDYDTRSGDDPENSMCGWTHSGIREIFGADYSEMRTHQIMNVGSVFYVETNGEDDIIALPYEDYQLTREQWIYLDTDVQILVDLPTPIEYDVTPIQINTKRGSNIFHADLTATEEYRGIFYYLTIDYKADPELYKVEDYALKTDTVLDTTLSINRNPYSKIGDHSVSIGHNNEASGIYSCAFGDNSIASGISSFAVGYYARATADYTFAAGKQTKANGEIAHAEGCYAEANGYCSYAIGYQTKANGSYSAAFGYYSIADGSNSFAGGASSNATGYASFAFGNEPIASGEQSVAFGYHTEANGYDSFASGSQTKAYGSESTAIGVKTIAKGSSSFAAGMRTNAIGYCSASFGSYTAAKDDSSFASGYNTIAGGPYMAAFGTYNVEEGIDSYPEWVAGTQYNPGDYVKITNLEYDYVDGYVCLIANSQEEFETEVWDEEEQDYVTYWEYVYMSRNALVVGNGDGDYSRSNAFAVGWDGAGRFGGNIYANCNSDSTGGELVLTSAMRGVANGVAGLDANGYVPTSQLPSYVDDVVNGYLHNNKFYEDSLYEHEIAGETGKVYVDLTTNLTYRWGGQSFVPIGNDLALGETSSTAYRGDHGKTAYDHASDSNRMVSAVSTGLYKIAVTNEGHIASVVAVTKSDITGLGIPGEQPDISGKVDKDAIASIQETQSIIDEYEVTAV